MCADADLVKCAVILAAAVVLARRNSAANAEISVIAVHIIKPPQKIMTRKNLAIIINSKMSFIHILSDPLEEYFIAADNVSSSV